MISLGNIMSRTLRKSGFPTGPLARWLFGSVGTYLVKHLHCSVLVAQTEIGDDQFARLLTIPAEQA
jgi:hypothetical protein